MRDQELDERKMLILKAVIDDYIETFEPVGSRTIVKKHDIGLSPATIRNEMADLEEMGYLSSPHTSAGRVPSTKGYRTYVDQMMAPLAENPAVAQDIISKLEGKMNEYQKLIKACTQIISEMTEYAAIGIAPGKERFVIKALQFVPVDELHVLVVIVAENNAVKNRVVTLNEAISPAKLIELSGVVNTSFSGRPAESISLVMLNEIVDITGISRNAILPIIDGIIDCVKEYQTTEVYTEGASKLLKSPEFDDVNKAREFFDLFQDKDRIENIIKTTTDENGNVKVTIGTENGTDGMDDYSVVSAKYEFDGVPLGTVSVVGPTRMDYKKVISALEYVQKMLEKKALEQNSNKDNKGEK